MTNTHTAPNTHATCARTCPARSQLHEHFYEVPASIKEYLQEVKAQLAMLTGVIAALGWGFWFGLGLGLARLVLVPPPWFERFLAAESAEGALRPGLKQQQTSCRVPHTHPDSSHSTHTPHHPTHPRLA
jgi:hypothetical protein